ncbi:MAG: hypothetical protein WC635_06295 [Bacteriovorax sp.]|jgi:3-phosphoshikimate 1-carboxyvinyltransferase
MNSENSLYKVLPLSFDKEILLPTSKSHANRALIIGAIRGSGFQVQSLPLSTDVTTLLNCFKTVGLLITHNEDSVIFNNSFPACEAEIKEEIIDLKTGDGGTTNRFLLALLSLGKKTYRFFPSEKMSGRPIDDLLIPLRKLKVSVQTDIGGAWITLKGPAQINADAKIEIDCSKSTQFASALMLAFSQQSQQFELKNIIASETYLKMTEHVLSETKLKKSYDVPVDFSSLSYPLALALIKGKVLIKNCKTIDPLQADSKFIKLMQDSGADIQWTDKGLLAISKNNLKPFLVDGSQFPDLVPTLVFMAAHIPGKSTLKNLSVLRHKESDRLEQILKLLKLFSVKYSFDEAQSEIMIEGRTKAYPEASVKPARDHRIVMTAYLFLRANSGGSLAEYDCVEKSFPHFFNIMCNSN